MHCRADHRPTQRLSYQEFNVHAPWRSTFLDNDGFMARLRRPLHPLVAHRFFNRHTYRYDLLHLIDHHGAASHVAGNILWSHLCGAREGDVLPGSNMQQRLDFLNNDIKAYYSMYRVSNRLPPLRDSNIKDSKASAYPELKGHGVKGANTRSLMKFIQLLQERATAQQPTPKNKHMNKLADSLQEAYDIMYNGTFFLSDGDVVALRRALFRFGEHYKALHDLAVDEGVQMWKIVPKLHFLCAHVPVQAEIVNPRYTQGYTSESMVGAVCQIYSTSQSGPFHSRIQDVALVKYCTGLNILWTG